MHQHAESVLLHQLRSAAGSRRLFQQSGVPVQNPTFLYLALECGDCAELDRDIYNCCYTGSVEGAKRCHACDTVRKYESAG